MLVFILALLLRITSLLSKQCPEITNAIPHLHPLCPSGFLPSVFTVFLCERLDIFFHTPGDVYAHHECYSLNRSASTTIERFLKRHVALLLRHAPFIAVLHVWSILVPFL